MTPDSPRNPLIPPDLRVHSRDAGGARPPVRRLATVVFAAILLLLVVPAAAQRWTDFLWFRSIGYERVFLLRIAAWWSLAIATGVVAFATLWLNMRLAFRGLDVDQLTVLEKGREAHLTAAAILGRTARRLATPACIFLSLLIALGAASGWRTLVQFWYRTPFGATDPVFHRDIAYYVFTVPMVSDVLGAASAILWITLLVIVLPAYVVRGDIGVRGLKPHIDPAARVHLSALIAGLVGLAGIGTLTVDIPSILTSDHGPLLFGASYTDLHVTLPAMRFMGVVALLVAALVLAGAWTGSFVRNGIVVLAGYFLLDVLALGIVPSAYQRLVVQPSELDKEAPQLRNFIAGTRQAWGIDSVGLQELSAVTPLTLKELQANTATISNVRLWDREPLLQTFGQLQAIRTYYDFVNVDDDRYRLGGEERQVLLSARELDPSSLPTRTFVNEHLTYTHGMGLTLGPSNQVTDEGLPVLWVKDLPPASSVGITITRPQIYFGELDDDFILAPSRQKEFDYPSAEGGSEAAVYSSYAGRDGVAVGSFLRKLLLAFRFQSLNILFSDDVRPDTKLLFHRNVAERAALALPFLQFDGDPYLVVSDSGRLKWILDAYTATDQYPYAQPLGNGTNYMRNSVKVVVDAYDGDVRAYLVDPHDPMIRTLAKIYPTLLRPLSELSPDLRAHLRYPLDLFNIQTQLYATFHMTNPETFYHREDQWQVPLSTAQRPRGGSGGSAAAFMRHIVMTLPGEKTPEYILMRPFTPRQKDNLAAWMVARNDPAHYGQLIAYQFPRQSLVFGPTQIVNRINQNTDVSRQVSLWDQRGSEVIRGELLVIPIDGSLLYVQPLYLRAEGGKIPELKRVVVAYGSEVAMEATLEGGLQRIFGGGGAAPSLAAADSLGAGPVSESAAGAGGGDIGSLARQAQQHYDRARAAQRNDDWATYGAEMKALGDALGRMGAAKAATPTTPKKP